MHNRGTAQHVKDPQKSEEIWTHKLGSLSKDTRPVGMVLLFYEHLTFLSFHQFCDRIAVIGGSLA
jgi:hypothetical protein